MIVVFKRIAYLSTCLLYIPIFSLITGLWITSGIIITCECCMYMPIEYIITGRFDTTSEMIEYIWYILPEKYQKVVKYFFKKIRPENDDDNNNDNNNDNYNNNLC